MAKKKDLTGLKYGRLTVIREGNGRRTSSGVRRVTWICQCSCGNVIETTAVNLTNGDTKSCGCLKSDITAERNRTARQPNKYDLDSYDYGIGWTGNGTEFKFSKSDYELIYPYRWNINPKWNYIAAHEIDNHSQAVYLHRLIMGVHGLDYKEIQVDHLNGDPTDCRRENLRICTSHDNAKNKSIYKNNKTGVQGVYWDTTKQRYIATAYDNNHKQVAFAFKNLSDAIKKRKELENLYYGEYTREKSLQQVNGQCDIQVQSVIIINEQKEEREYGNTI